MARGLYKKLQLRQENGEKLDFQNITNEELEQLWRYESVPDYEIANLYGVTKETVFEKMYKLVTNQNKERLITLMKR